MMQIKSTAGLLLITAFVTACSSVLTSDTSARRHYLLEPYTGATSAPESEALPSLVISVVAVPGLDSDRILALGSDAHLTPYANARWVEHLPEVLTSVMRRSLMSTGQFESVKAATAAGNGEWMIMLEVQQFYGIQNVPGETSSVEVRFTGSLLCDDSEHKLMLNTSKSVRQENLSTVVAAHQQGLNDVIQQLLDQIRNACY
jgi:ABC-type uncharacterized transport system auxiliary subunit